MSDQSQTHKRRRLYIIDRKWQLPLVMGMGSATLGAGLLLLLTNYLFSAPDTLDSMTGQETAELVLALEVGFIAVLCTLLVWATLRITNAVSGPAMLLERAIEAIRVGRFDSRLSLRKGDYLKGVASSLQLLSNEIQERQHEWGRVCSNLNKALSEGNVSEARALLLDLEKVVDRPQGSSGADVRPGANDQNAQPSLLPSRDDSSARVSTTSATKTAPEGKNAALRGRGGFTLIETLIGLIVLSVGIGSSVMTSVRCAQMQRSTEEMIEAHNASRDVIEHIRSGGLAARLAEYTAAPTFHAGELQVNVQFPTTILSQGLGGVIPNTSRFRDLNNDGTIELNPGATDTFGLLPVRVTANRAGFRYQVDTLVVGP